MENLKVMAMKKLQLERRRLRTTTMQLRLEPEIKEKAERDAQKFGMGKSEYVEYLIKHAEFEEVASAAAPPR